MEKQAFQQQLVEELKRTSPFVVTEFQQKKHLLEDIPLRIGYTIILETLIQPYGLYDILNRNAAAADKTILIEWDLLQEDLGFWAILEGALGFDSNKGKLSEVEYGDYPKFTFCGKLILCTDLTKRQIKSRKELDFINHYCHFI